MSPTGKSNVSLMPTILPSLAPSLGPYFQSFEESNVIMSLEGLQSLSSTSAASFSNVTASFIARTVNDSLIGVADDVTVDIVIVSQSTSRDLSGSTTVTFDVMFTLFSAIPLSQLAPQFVESSFNSNQSQVEYITALKSTNDPSFAGLSSVTVSVSTMAPTPNPHPPSLKPTPSPTCRPTLAHRHKPPTHWPTNQPTDKPTNKPSTKEPSVPIAAAGSEPTSSQSNHPTDTRHRKPTHRPRKPPHFPMTPTDKPSPSPSRKPATPHRKPHVSVRRTHKPTSPPVVTIHVPPGACFSGLNTVQVETKGYVAMKDLQIGDKVRDAFGNMVSIYSFGHRHPTAEAEYLQIYVGGQSEPLEISRDHMLFVNGSAVPASMVYVGGKISLGAPFKEQAEVKMIKLVVRRGAYAPFTTSGTIIVSGVAASSYVSLQPGSSVLVLGNYKTPLSMHWLAHASQTPHRMLCSSLGLTFCRRREIYNRDGISNWTERQYRVALWLVSQNGMTMAIIFIPAFCLGLLLYAIMAGWMHLIILGTMLSWYFGNQNRKRDQ